MWININNFKVYRTHSEIRDDFPNISMPAHLTDEIIRSLGILVIIKTERPSGYVVEEAPPSIVEDNWVQQWKVREPTEEETLDKAKTVRDLRNSLLDSSDKLVIKSLEQELPVPLEYSKYRQALRDITQQPGFPWEVVWPTL